MQSDGPYRAQGTLEPDEPPPDPRGPWVLQTWVSRRPCPDCGIALFAAKKEGYRIDACGRCGGAWIDQASIGRAVEERSLVPALLSDEAARRAPEPQPDRQGRACPDCQAPLAATRVHDAGVLIDLCDGHGAWFDPRELRAVIEALVRRRPPEVDPEVDRIIAEEARRGALRPPESYDVGYGFLTLRQPMYRGDAFAELLDELGRKRRR